MIIPGFIITWVTFWGVIVHEFAHKIFCHLTGTKVIKVCYFQFENPAGYVIHEPASSVWRHLLVAVGPLFVNSIIGFTLALAALPLREEAGGLGFTYGMLMWISISVAMHSFPSVGDAKSIWASIRGPDAPVGAKLIGTPLVGLIFIGAIGSVVWLDLMYGIAVTIGLPEAMHLR